MNSNRRTWLISALLGLLSVPAATAQAGQEEVTPEVQALYAQAKAAQEHGDDAAAIAKYRAMIKQAPHLAPAYNNLGRLYFNQHDYAHAAAVLAQGLAVDPNMHTASTLLGMSYYQLGAHEKAAPLLESAVEANPADDNLQMALAHNLIDLGQYDAATQRLRSFLDLHPKDQPAWYLLGKTYLQLSEDALGQIHRIDPNSITAHLVAGEIDESMHNYDGALVEYKKAIELGPGQPGSHEHMGDAYWVTGKWESAEIEFKQELSHNPDNCNAHWKLANATLEANGSAQEALTDLNQALERCPALMQARVDRGRALIKLDRQKDALPDLLMAEKDSPGEPSIHFLLSQDYKVTGQPEQAHQELRAYADLQRAASEASAERASDAISIKSTAH